MEICIRKWRSLFKEKRRIGSSPKVEFIGNTWKVLGDSQSYDQEGKGTPLFTFGLATLINAFCGN